MNLFCNYSRSTTNIDFIVLPIYIKMDSDHFTIDMNEFSGLGLDAENGIEVRNNFSRKSSPVPVGL